MKNSKPFWKVVYIVLIIGLIAMILGAALGGIRNTCLSYNEYNINTIEKVVNHFLDNEDHINIEFKDGVDIYEEDIDVSEEASDIDSLDITIGGAKVEVKETDGDSINITSEDANEIQYYISDNTLYINARYIDVGYSSHSLIIEIPEDKKLDAFNLEMGAGAVLIDEITAEDIKIKLGAGSCNITDAYTESLDVQVGMGEFVYEGFLENKASIECVMGSTMLKLDNAKSEFSYDLSCFMGNISYGNYNISGVGSKSSHEVEENLIEVECGMGDVSVIFLDENTK